MCGRGLTKSRWNRFPDTRNRNRFPRRDLRCVSWSDTARDAAMGHLVPNCPPSPRARQVVRGVADSSASRDAIPPRRNFFAVSPRGDTQRRESTSRAPFRGAPRLCCAQFLEDDVYTAFVTPTPTPWAFNPRNMPLLRQRFSHLERGHEAAFIDKCGNIGGRAARLGSRRFSLVNENDTRAALRNFLIAVTAVTRVVEGTEGPLRSESTCGRRKRKY